MNASFFAYLWLFVFPIIVFGPFFCAFFIAKRKSPHPGIVYLITGMLTFLPPLSHIYIAILSLKDDTNIQDKQ